MAATPDTSQAKPTDARALTVVVVLGAWAIAVLLLVVYLDRRGQPSPSNSLEATAPVTRSFPAPPAGAVVFSREAGQNALALGVVPGARRVRVQASVVGPDAVGVSGLATTFSRDGATASGTACGAGCYRADLRPRGEPRSGNWT